MKLFAVLTVTNNHCRWINSKYSNQSSALGTKLKTFFPTDKKVDGHYCTVFIFTHNSV